MDFTPSGWAAQYDPSESDDHVMWRPVERWDGDGMALVVDERLGRLMPAQNMRGFKRLTTASRIVTAIPATPGWHLKFWNDDRDDDSAYQVPIAAWIVDSRGALSPVPHSSDSHLEPALNQRSEIIAP